MQQPKCSNVTTRSQIAARRAIFPFTCLPPELRYMIYEYLVTWEPITYHINPKPFSNKSGPSVPVILLLTRQIRTEALSVLYTQPLILEHQIAQQEFRFILPSTLPAASLPSLAVLSRVQHVTLKLEPCLIHNMLWAFLRDFVAAAELISRCCHAWRPEKGKHKLKSLLVAMDGPEWESAYRAGGLKEESFFALAQQQLGGLRGIEKVTLTGVAEEVLGEYKQLMESHYGASGKDETKQENGATSRTNV